LLRESSGINDEYKTLKSDAIFARSHKDQIQKVKFKSMTRQEIEREVKNVFQREFEIENPDMDADLRETYEFDSIDAIELLLAIENFLGSEISQEEKKQAINIRTINQICDYIEKIAVKRNLFSPA
jgi:acyl carrier protein